jgi:hypothetical protein
MGYLSVTGALAAVLGRDSVKTVPEIVDAPRQEYERCRRRFERRLGARREQWLEEYDGDCFGDVSVRSAAHLYAVTRTRAPETVVETGVCNGVSTLAILLGMEANGHGQLHSVDLPHRADESLDEFRQETWDGYGGACIPADKDPGWIVPEHLRDRWTLHIGKSQHELPVLLPEIAPVDVFLHDSEHSAPCQMFEYELAWHHLADDGLLVSDDINWTGAFERFVDDRHARHAVDDGLGVVRPEVSEQ